MRLLGGHFWRVFGRSRDQKRPAAQWTKPGAVQSAPTGTFSPTGRTIIRICTLETTPKPEGFVADEVMGNNWHHDETQAVQMLNNSEGIDSATLYITRDYICSSCINLEEFLSEGKTLTVVYVNKFVISTAIKFTGILPAEP